MSSLSQIWEDMNYDEDTVISSVVSEFREKVRMTVARDYPWMVAELFEIEGDLGWGPGFREYDDEYSCFPERTWYANAKMLTFLKTLEHCEKDNALVQAIQEAKGMPTRKLATMLRRFMEKTDKNDYEEFRAICKVYGLIATRRSEYTLGGARIYFALYTEQKKFLLALAGLLRLFYSPLVKVKVDAETIRRQRTFSEKVIAKDLVPSSYQAEYLYAQ